MAVCQTTKMSGMGIDRDSHCLQQSGLQGLQCGLGRHDLSLDRHGFLSFLLLPHLDSGAAPPVGASLLAMAVCQTTKMSGMGIDRDSHCLQQSGLQGLQCGLGRHDLSLDRHGFLSFLLLPHLDSGAAPLWERACSRWRSVRQPKCQAWVSIETVIACNRAACRVCNVAWVAMI